MIIARLICEITRGTVTTYEKVSEKVKEFVDAIDKSLRNQKMVKLKMSRPTLKFQMK